MTFFVSMCGIGGLLLLISVFFFDHDYDGLGGFISLKIISVFMASFGAGGMLYLNSNDSYPFALAAGTITGLIMVLLARFLFKIVSSQQSSSTTLAQNFIGLLGEVKIDIPSNGIGEIVVCTQGKQIYLPARSYDNQAIKIGTSIKVLLYNSSNAIVEKI